MNADLNHEWTRMGIDSPPGEDTRPTVARGLTRLQSFFTGIGFVYSIDATRQFPIS